MTKSEENAQSSMDAGGAEPPVVDVSPPEDDAADDSTAGDTDAATGVCDDTFKTGGDEDEDEYLEESELEAAPLHLHTLRVPARLRGSTTPIGVRSRSSSRSRSNSRDVSPSPASKAGSDGGKGHRRTSSRESDKVPSLVPGTETSGGTVSSGSSIVDSEIDPDILLDRAGFEEMEPPLPHEVAMGPLASPGMNVQAGHSSGVLPSVNERMSEETLDDCHAFTELTNALHHSLRSLKDNEGGEDKDQLDPLPEADENDEELDDDNGGGLTEEERLKLIQKQKDIEAKKRAEEEAEKAKSVVS
uniref:Uncharacterized protein n=2 Tax=Odontella aurita TaxID=265563 RepID=A0A7S4N9I5_9STRA|eukprot:CAMPEP_0113542834 /NCGR_PEP_ID=MMETSP0015_2-20120614/9828_1 /TAXON_ID=2838 /ORGANISM="Odontella" /LENGTH=301 /DNA_ID=CAMNT_0000442937 /DNA_START=35 /DNA_END=940 /DNA_ORIENTATION=- /assembly_acc=CAM_ASM_000160